MWLDGSVRAKNLSPLHLEKAEKVSIKTLG